MRTKSKTFNVVDIKNIGRRPLDSLVVVYLIFSTWIVVPQNIYYVRDFTANAIVIFNSQFSRGLCCLQFIIPCNTASAASFLISLNNGLLFLYDIW